MGKKNKSKKNSKSNKGKLSKSTDNKIDFKLLQDLTLFDIFRFKNGDVYVGEFTLTVEGSIVRHGKGHYFSSDGCVQGGRWQNDVLVDAVRVVYPDSCCYQGTLEGGRYEGPGRYFLPHLGTLGCLFWMGRPRGQVTLTDLDGFKWQGHADAANGSLTLIPRNHCFDSEDVICKATLDALSGKTSHS